MQEYFHHFIEQKFICLLREVPWLLAQSSGFHRFLTQASQPLHPVTCPRSCLLTPRPTPSPARRPAAIMRARGGGG